MNREFAQLVSIRRVGHRSRWYGPGISLCLAGLQISPAPRRRPVNWDKVLGLAAALLIVALGWTVTAVAVLHFLR